MNYLYNGVELPALPEWDKVKYPYAYIVHDIDGAGRYEYVFCMEPKPVTVLLRTTAFSGTVSASDWTSRYFGYENNAWVSGSGGIIGSVIWSNTDVYYKDSIEGVGGTLYLAASEPIPVGSAPDIEPLPFTEGLRIGQIVRAMRT
jgi:hypothetical protein